MTRTRHKLRGLTLAALMVFSVFAMAAPAGALDGVRGNVGTSTVVFLGEENVDLSTSGGVSSGSETFTGVAGDADGDTLTVSDTSSTDVDAAVGFTTGGYDTTADGNSDGNIDFSVKKPKVTNVEIRTEATDADVTGGTVPQDTNVTVEAEYNFDQASYVEVDVMDDSGTNIISTVNTSRPGTTPPVGVIRNSGDEIILNLTDADIDSGVQYTVVARGADDGDDAGEDDNRDLISTTGASNSETELNSASMSATFTIASADTQISLNKDEVTQGGTVTATVTGEPGEYRVVQVNENDGTGWEASNTSARNLFRDTSDVLNRTNNGTSFNAAIVALGDDGSGKAQLRSAYLDDSTVSVEAVEPTESGIDDHRFGPLAGGADDLDSDSDLQDARAAVSGTDRDDADVKVTEPDIEVTDSPAVAVIGEDFDIAGNAAEIDTVGAYAKLDDTYHYLGEAENVDADDTFELQDISTSQDPLELPGSYRIVVLDHDEMNDVLGAGTAGTDIDEDDFSELDRSGSFTLRTQEGSLSVSLNTNTVAFGEGDEVEVSGSAVGADEVRAYVVGPRGTVSGEGGTGALESGSNWDTLSVDDDDMISEEESGDIFTTRGTYQVYFIHPGRDGDFGNGDNADRFGGDADRLDDGGLSQSQASEIIRDVYEDAGEDDVIRQTSVKAEDASISLDEIGSGGQVTQGEVTVSGTSNREDGTTIFVEVLDDQNEAIASASTEVDGSTSSWETTLDMSGVELGSYTLRADDSVVTAEREIEVVAETDTPTPMTTTTEPPTTTTEPPTTTEEPTTEPPTTAPPTTEPPTTAPPTTTDTSGPGFGAVVAVIALLAAALLAVRRRD